MNPNGVSPPSVRDYIKLDMCRYVDYNMLACSIYIIIYIYIYLVYATREPPKLVRFDRFAISGYRAISNAKDLKLGILFSSQNVRLVTLIKNK